MDHTFYVQITHRHKLAKVHQVPRVMKDKYLITQSWVSIGCATCSELLRSRCYRFPGSLAPWQNASIVSKRGLQAWPRYVDHVSINRSLPASKGRTFSVLLQLFS